MFDKDTITAIHEKLVDNPNHLADEYKRIFSQILEDIESSGGSEDEDAARVFAHSQALYLLTFPYLNKFELSMEEATYAMAELDYKLALYKKYDVIEF